MTAAGNGPTLAKRSLGATGLLVHPICLGTGPLDVRGAFTYSVSEEQATAFVRAAFAGPVHFLDTGASYGNGESERRIGEILREIGGLPAGFVLETKADRDSQTGSFSGDQTRRSVERSLRLLGLDRLQICYLHDPEYTPDDVLAKGGAVEALLRLRDEGVIEHVGVAMGAVDEELRLLRSGAFEVALNHNRYNLLNREAEPLLEYAAAHGIAFVNAAPYGSGILAKGPAAYPRFRYREAPPELIDRAERIQDVCTRHGVPLAAAALQFSLREPRIASTVVGMSKPERLAETVQLATLPTSAPFWEEIEALLPPPGST